MEHMPILTKLSFSAAKFGTRMTRQFFYVEAKQVKYKCTPNIANNLSKILKEMCHFVLSQRPQEDIPVYIYNTKTYEKVQRSFALLLIRRWALSY